VSSPGRAISALTRVFDALWRETRRSIFTKKLDCRFKPGNDSGAVARPSRINQLMHLTP
jgi:hypothetical protein